MDKKTYVELITAIDKDPRFSQWDAINQVRDMGASGQLLMRAPTATGKSKLALFAGIDTAASGGRTIIGTYTRLLQDSYRREIRETEIALERSGRKGTVTFAVLKGANNYICRIAVDRALNDASVAYLHKELKWLWTVLDGGDPEIPAAVDNRARELAMADSDDCAGHTADECGFVLAKKRAKEAKVVVTNHALLLINAVNPAVLGEHSLLVVDEIHNLPRAAESFSSHVIDMERAWAQAGKLQSLADAKNLDHGNGALMKAVEKLGQICFPGVPIGQNQPGSVAAMVSGTGFGGKQQVAGERVPSLTEIKDIVGVYNELIHPYQSLLSTKFAAGDRLKDIRGIKNWVTDAVAQAKLQMSGNTLSKSAEQIATVDTVVSTFRGKQRARNRLVSSVVDIGKVAKRALVTELRIQGYDESDVGYDDGEKLEEVFERRVVMMSATTGTPARPAYVANRCGVLNAKLTQVLSPLPYKSNMKVSLLEAGDTGPWGPLVDKLTRDTGGRSLVLMRSWRRVREIEDALRLLSDVTVFVQAEGDPKENQAQLRRFRQDETSILIGTASLFEGIDVPGPALSQVIIGELPIRMASSVVDQVRRSRAEDWINNEAIPYSALILEQMMGRLIRKMSDFGIVTVMDGAAKSGTGAKALSAACASYGVGLTERSVAVQWWKHKAKQEGILPVEAPF